jgi:hypothetical protein
MMMMVRKIWARSHFSEICSPLSLFSCFVGHIGVVILASVDLVADGHAVNSAWEVFSIHSLLVLPG